MTLEKLLEKIRRKNRFETRTNTTDYQRILELVRSKNQQRLQQQKHTNDLDQVTANLIITQVRERNREKQQLNYPTLNISDISPEYRVFVSDTTVDNPFVISSNLVRIIKNHVKGGLTEEEKAKRIYDWIKNNIQYGNPKKDYGYSDAEEILQYRKGICGEMAFLYIAMARIVGLKADFASIKRDCDNKKVHHGCAQVDIGKKKILVDPAYHTYDVKHKQYKILSDNDVIRRFSQWRKK